MLPGICFGFLRNHFGSAVLPTVLIGLSCADVQAGQIYGSVIAAGKPVGAALVVITCAGADTKGATNADGTYRVNVIPQGRCSLTLPGYAGTPSTVIFSYDKPTLYDLEVVRRADGTFELRIR